MTSFTVVQRTSTQSISNGAFVAVSWSSALTDPLGAFSGGSPTIVTVPSGITGVEALIYTAWAGGSGERAVRLLKNGTVIDANYPMKSDTGQSPSHSCTRRFAVTSGDTLSWEVFQTSGAALFFYSSVTGHTPYAQFKWIA